MDKTCKEIRETLKRYESKIVAAGGYVDYSDFGLSGAAVLNGKGIWLSQHFRRERDGHIGYKLITEELLDEWISATGSQTPPIPDDDSRTHDTAL